MLEPSEELVDPPADRGRLDLDGDRARTDASANNPSAGDLGREHARRWAERYEAVWRAGDPEAAAARYARDVRYRSEPFRDPHRGRQGVLAYTREAYATEADQEPRFGIPFAAAASAAVEWWTTTLEEGQPVSLTGTHRPFEGWGR